MFVFQRFYKFSMDICWIQNGLFGHFTQTQNYGIYSNTFGNTAVKKFFKSPFQTAAHCNYRCRDCCSILNESCKSEKSKFLSSCCENW